MVKERIDDLVDILAEEFSKMENTFLIRNNQQLIKYVENPEKWKAMQMANRNAYKKVLISDAKQRLQILNSKSEKVLLLSYREVDKDVIEIREKELVVNKYQKEIQAKIKEMRKFNERQVALLANSAYQIYIRTVKIIDQTSSADNLFEVIKRQMPKGIRNAIPVTYKDGKQMNWRSYMEMNARTTISQEITEREIQVGADANIIFYICDSFADCAKDHADYQGKIYYNEKTKLTKEAEEYIRENGILSMQEVSNNDPWLTTRPNCRHNFHAISTEEVLGGKSANKILQDENLITGKYEESNYKDLQQQRYNERQIRKWKTELENQQQLGKTTGQPNAFAQQRAREKISEWQGKQRELIKSNPNVLKRNYDRENAKIIVEDLGVRYRYKVENGELKKK